jgi:hypothetical protein
MPWLVTRRPCCPDWPGLPSSGSRPAIFFVSYAACGYADDWNRPQVGLRSVNIQQSVLRDMEERRSTPRRRVLKGGKIVFNDMHSIIDCTVRNLSDGGALLMVTSVIGIPDEFDLRISDGATYSCRVVRRTGTQIGVEFIQPAI